MKEGKKETNKQTKRGRTREIKKQGKKDTKK